MGKSVTRLYDQFQPAHYDLVLHPDKDSMTFSGSVTIRGKKVGRPSKRLTLHTKGFKVEFATVTKHDKKGDQLIQLDRINLQKSYDELRLHSKDMLYPSDYTIYLEFNGKITTGMTGLYPCFFKVDGDEHALLMTQFESHHAREVFPCIDEPEAKATFSLTLTSPANEVVLANTPIKEQTKFASDDGGQTASNARAGTTTRLYNSTTFETSPKMSTYLLAFVIGELQCKTTKTKSGVDVNTWATIAQPTNSLDFALNIAKKSVEFFEDYFNVPYPLAKLDHVACPDFAAGAMENWGLITYRERALLVYQDNTAQSVQEHVAVVIAHETAHQWFGNLVTMKWWDDLWLNESFANMMEYEAVNAMHPEWHMWNIFIAQDGLGALRRDATPGVQAVKTAVNQPDEISTLFDPSIVYSKGGRLLYMLKNYIGEDAFRKGLSAYFAKHAYGNTTGADLWASLSEVSGQDVGAFMNPWLERSGFPMVSITQSGSDVQIEQEHFLDNPEKTDTDRLWPIPLFTDIPNLPNALTDRTLSLVLPSRDTMLLNTYARGHYIVRYVTDGQKEAVIGLIRQQKLSEADRLMLLNGGSMMARAGYEPYGNILAMLGAYQNEVSDPVWDIMALIIAESRRFIDLDENLEEKIKSLIRTLIAQQYTRLGWKEKPGETTADQKLRATIIGLGAYADEPNIIAKSLEQFEQYKVQPGTVPAELRSIVFTVPVKLATPAAVEFLLELHDNTSNSDLQTDICAALTATRDKKTAAMLLNRLKNPKLVKPQDADHWLVYLLRSRYVGDIAWDWMEQNWNWIIDTYKQDKSYDMFPRYAASICNTKFAAERYRKFFKPKMAEIALKRNIVIGLEEISSRVAWLQRDLKSVQKFFRM